MRRRLAFIVLFFVWPAAYGHAQTGSGLEDAALSKDLRAFYEARAFRPVWFADGRLTERGRELVEILSRASEIGLNADDYPIPQDLRIVDGSRGEQIELLLARSALTYTDHAVNGRIDPRAIHDGWNLPREAEPAGTVLAAALASGQALAEALSPPYDAYKRLEEALSEYRRIEEAGGWERLSEGATLRRGDVDQRVTTVRARLRSTGDLEQNAPLDDPNFDSTVDRAVRDFQERHGLEVDGIVGPQTRAAMNVTVRERIRQIVINLERLRWLPTTLAKRHALVNVAGFRLDVFEDGKPVLGMKIIVGKPSTPTPLFSTEIEGVILAPYWYVPQSIAKNEILPKLEQNPFYLERNQMRMLETGTIRQEPGPRNPLGRLKFVIPNRFGVGLHDTNEPGLFSRNVCAFSHGCMRAEHPVDLALYVLRGTSWTRAELERVISAWKQHRIEVPDPLPLHLVYWTAWAEPDETVHFRRDIYGHDVTLTRIMSE